MANNHKSFTQIPFNNIEENMNNRTKALLVNLSHSSKRMNDGSKFDLFPSSSFIVSAPPMAPEPSEGMLTENDQLLKFDCKYCQRKFANKQALGGHQNKHRVLRFIEKNKKDAMIEMRYLANDLPRPVGYPFVRPHALNGAMVNSPYYVPFTQKERHGYHSRGSGASEPPCHHYITIEQGPTPMITNSFDAPPIIMGHQIADRSYFSIDESGSFIGENIPTAPVNGVSTAIPKLQLDNTKKTRENVESSAAKIGGNVESNEPQKLQTLDPVLDLTLKLGY